MGEIINILLIFSKRRTFVLEKILVFFLILAPLLCVAIGQNALYYLSNSDSIYPIQVGRDVWDLGILLPGYRFTPAPYFFPDIVYTALPGEW